jgi:23S rRNA A2030 N6-methylase RlmJ
MWQVADWRIGSSLSQLLGTDSLELLGATFADEARFKVKEASGFKAIRAVLVSHSQHGTPLVTISTGLIFGTIF